MNRKTLKKGCLKLLLAWVWAAFAFPLQNVALASGNVDFPGPVEHQLLAGPLSGLAIPWTPSGQEFLIVGEDAGNLSLVYHVANDVLFNTYARFHLGGRVTWLGPWQGGPYGDLGVVALTANPDRLHFIQVSYEEPFFLVQQTVELPEDPGPLAFVASGALGQDQLAIALPGIDQVLVLAEDDGQWAIQQALPTGNTPASLASLDIDGDQIPELITGDRGPLSGSLTIFKQQPAGSFDLLRHEHLPGAVHGIGVLDADQDGAPDLAVSYSDRLFMDFFSAGSGNWAHQDSLAVPVTPDSFQALDLPGGVPGIIARNEFRGTMDLFLRQGGQWSHDETYFVGCRPVALVVGDLNGDHMDEVACLDEPAALVTILLGNNKPGFWGFPGFYLPSVPGAVILSDLDQNGMPDLVVGSGNPNLLSWYPRQMDGTIRPTPLQQELDFFPGAMVAADLFGNGQPDLVVLDLFQQRLMSMRWQGEAGFSQQALVDLPGTTGQLKTADIDGDGFEDLYLALISQQRVEVLYGNGDGTFATPVFVDLPVGAQEVGALALNQDDFLDLVVTDGQNRLWRVLNQQGRAFGPPIAHEANSGARFLVLADLDGDQDLDVVVANNNSRSLTLFENPGDGTLVRRIGSLGLGAEPVGLDCADMNGDGLPDVVALMGGGAGLRVVEAEDVWQYVYPAEYPTPADITKFLVEDFTLDGKPDVLNLDSELELGLIMVNTTRMLVAVEPEALAAHCLGTRMQVLVTPDRSGSWSLSWGGADQWQLLAADGRAEVGRLTSEGHSWTLMVDLEDLEFLNSSPGLRLTLGQSGNTESLDLNPECQGQGNPVPNLRWQDRFSPNPFNPIIRGRIRLDHASEVEACVFDASGRRLATLWQGMMPSGTQELVWDGQQDGRPVAAGVYLLRVQSEAAVLSQKIILLK